MHYNFITEAKLVLNTEKRASSDTWQEEISAQADGPVNYQQPGNLNLCKWQGRKKCPDKQYRKPVEHTAN